MDRCYCYICDSESWNKKMCVHYNREIFLNVAVLHKFCYIDLVR